ncbi:hypothetical protein Phi87_101 [Enterobacteria phage UAB_Phi87]|uniref:Uncharacterized protein n=1 Tax=Enterobacteria phage UAB_Phi87 TaxID=1197935 RepID=M1FLN9_9CAUD|nr:hypothetical protein Phi87_101 [Enterobacteria phage UAB_Phi87]AFQ96142.1 hypothetical protein Phi87_101 [Enterobacteria phage UAB_Phi87]UIS31713.1 hypothetical protein UAB69_gp117 [Salmonella phage UAB_69]
MTLADVIHQLHDNCYTPELIQEMLIVVMPSKFLKGFNREALKVAHILIVDGKIARDRTGVLKGERIDILELL